MSFPPRLFLIGAQKSGTTLLADLLGQHPEVCLADPKEPSYFSSHWKRHDLRWYRDRFARLDAPWLLDASTSYSCARLRRYDADAVDRPGPLDGVPGRIAETCDDPRFLYIMREPASRAYSSYWHAVRAGDEDRPFERAIEEQTTYLRAGEYAAQLELYVARFPRSSMHLVFFEHLREDPVGVARDCFRFLGLDADAPVAVAGARNRSFTYSGAGRWLGRVMGPFGGLRGASRGLRRVLPPGIRGTAERILTRPIPPMTEAWRRRLHDHYREANRRLSREFGVTPPWPAADPVERGSRTSSA